MKRKNVRRKILMGILSLCLVCGLMPSMAFADGGTIMVKDLNELTAAITSQTSPIAIRLTDDITIDTTLEIKKTVTLDLNGHVLKYENSSKKGSVIKVKNSGYLTLLDNNTEILTHKFTVNDDGLWVLDEDNGTQTVSGGIITGGNSDNKGGGLSIEDSGAFIMYGGSIVGCTATNGGGVYMNGESLRLDGGKIIGCTATENGGGVYFYKKSFDIYSGEVSNCRAKKGGAIFICDIEKPAEDNNTYKINMSGGSITDCSASGDGGGIYIQAGDFNMTGGTITNCETGDTGSGGAICMIEAVVNCPKSCNVEISGGTISGCSAYIGRGIYAQNKKGNLIITGGKISNDCSTEEDKVYDVYIYICDFIMSGGDVSGLYIEINDKTQAISGGTVHACDIDETDAVVSGGTFYGKFENSGKIADDCCEVKYMNGEDQYAMQIVGNGSTTSALEAPTNVGYKLSGWYTDKEGTRAFNFKTETIINNITLYAKWEVCTHEYSSWSDAICNVCGYERTIVYHSGGSSVQTPTIAETTNGTISLSSSGRIATITPDKGYEIACVTVNGEEKGAVSTLTGLATGDKVVVTFQKTKDKLDAEAKTAVTSLSSMKARSSKTAKGNTKVVLSLSDADKQALTKLTDLGYTVKYRFYRSTKKSSGYKAMLEGMTGTYTNTYGKSGTRYYYKAQVRVYDEDGTLVAKTALKQCKYACRKF